MAGALPVPSNPRYHTLDCWRGVACLMIVIIHAAHFADEGVAAAGALARGIMWVVSYMGVGVPMFFVISGYCIAATADATRRRDSAPSEFFLRRFRRIFPPYLAVVMLCISVAVLATAAGWPELVSDEYAWIPHPARMSLPQWLGNLTLTETWRPHLFGGPELKVVGPAWTLCYEEQFYAVCGVVLVAAPRRFFTVVAGITLLTLAVMPLGLVPGGLAIQGFFFDGRWLIFAEGVAVYYVLNYSKSRFVQVAPFVTLVLAAVAVRWGIPAVAPNDVWRNRAFEFFASTAFALALVVLHPADGWSARAWLTRPLSFCGRMCYSLYLVHWPVAVVLPTLFHQLGVRGVWPHLLFVAPLTVTASVLASWLFHRAVESKYLNVPVLPSPSALRDVFAVPALRAVPVAKL